MKKLIHISISFVLAISIVLGYTGVTIYKMVCAAEQGITHVSVMIVEDDCDLHALPQTDDCCKPVAKTNQVKDKHSCCDYSHTLQKLSAQTVTQKVKNSTGHYLQTIFKSNRVNAVVCLNTSNINTNHLALPPLLHLKKQPYLSFIQVYLI